MFKNMLRIFLLFCAVITGKSQYNNLSNNHYSHHPTYPTEHHQNSHTQEEIRQHYNSINYNNVHNNPYNSNLHLQNTQPKLYGKFCLNIRCANTEVCVLKTDACNRGQIEGLHCGRYPSCLRVGTHHVSHSQGMIPISQSNSSHFERMVYSPTSENPNHSYEYESSEEIIRIETSTASLSDDKIILKIQDYMVENSINNDKKLLAPGFLSVVRDIIITKEEEPNVVNSDLYINRNKVDSKKPAMEDMITLW